MLEKYYGPNQSFLSPDGKNGINGQRPDLSTLGNPLSKPLLDGEVFVRGEVQRLYSNEDLLSSEKEHRLDQEVSDYLAAFLAGTKFSPEAEELYPETKNIGGEIYRIVSPEARTFIHRNNQMVEIFANPEFTDIVTKEKEMRGNCAVGLSGCVDGRIPWAHIVSHLAGVTESLAGVIDTFESQRDGNIRLQSQTLKQAVLSRPTRESDELLEIFLAHSENGVSNCGAMGKLQKEREVAGIPFESGDLIQENLQLFEPGIKAITRTYNSAARVAGKHALEKVAIRGVYDTGTMGILFGYGEEQPLSTTELAEQFTPLLSADLPALFDDDRLSAPGVLKDNFTDPKVFIEKERLIVNIMSYLTEQEDFVQTVTNGFNRLSELEGLNDNQKQALLVKMSRWTASHYLTGTHLPEVKGNHPFTSHAEKIMAITVDDGFGITLGKYDPEIQVFGASTSSIDEAADHVATETFLMDHNDEVEAPYLLFISSGIAAGSENNNQSLKQAQSNVGNAFNGITEHPKVLPLIQEGRVVPVPVIMSNLTGEVVKIPSLAL